MNIVIGPRGSGRTRYLIEQAVITGGTIVCGSRDEVRNIFLYDGGKEKGIEYPITYDEFISGKYVMGKYDIRFLIDDIDRLLKYIARENVIDTITICTHESDVTQLEKKVFKND